MRTKGEREGHSTPCPSWCSRTTSFGASGVTKLALEYTQRKSERFEKKEEKKRKKKM